MRPRQINAQTGEANIEFEGINDLVTALVLIERWGTEAGLDPANIAEAAKKLSTAIGSSETICVVSVPEPDGLLDVLSKASMDNIPHAGEMVKRYEELFVLDDCPGEVLARI